MSRLYEKCASKFYVTYSSRYPNLEGATLFHGFARNSILYSIWSRVICQKYTHSECPHTNPELVTVLVDSTACFLCNIVYYALKTTFYRKQAWSKVKEIAKFVILFGSLKCVIGLENLKLLYFTLVQMAQNSLTCSKRKSARFQDSKPWSF